MWPCSGVRSRHVEPAACPSATEPDGPAATKAERDSVSPLSIVSLLSKCDVPNSPERQDSGVIVGYRLRGENAPAKLPRMGRPCDQTMFRGLALPMDARPRQ